MILRILTLLFFAPMLAHAQTFALSPVRPKALAYLGTVSIAATPGLVNFTLAQGGAVTGSTPISIKTSMSGVGLAATLQVTAYFATSNALTDGAGNNIPSSAVLGMCSTCVPTTYTAFTQSGSFGSNSSLLLINTSTTLSIGGGSRTDALNLKIDLSGVPQTPAGSYSGTLVVAVQAF